MVLIVNGLTRGTLLAGLLLLSLLGRPTNALADGGGLPNERLGQSTAPLLLLSRSDVRLDLRLSEAQSQKAEQAIVALYTRAQGLKGKKGAAADSARKTIDQDQVLWIDKNLTHPTWPAMGRPVGDRDPSNRRRHPGTDPRTARDTPSGGGGAQRREGQVRLLQGRGGRIDREDARDTLPGPGRTLAGHDGTAVVLTPLDGRERREKREAMTPYQSGTVQRSLARFVR